MVTDRFSFWLVFWLHLFSLFFSGDKCSAEGWQQSSGAHTVETAGQRGLGPELQHWTRTGQWLPCTCFKDHFKSSLIYYDSVKLVRFQTTRACKYVILCQEQHSFEESDLHLHQNSVDCVFAHSLSLHQFQGIWLGSFLCFMKKKKILFTDSMGSQLGGGKKNLLSSDSQHGLIFLQLHSSLLFFLATAGVAFHVSLFNIIDIYSHQI